MMMRMMTRLMMFIASGLTGTIHRWSRGRSPGYHEPSALDHRTGSPVLRMMFTTLLVLLSIIVGNILHSVAFTGHWWYLTTEICLRNWRINIHLSRIRRKRRISIWNWSGRFGNQILPHRRHQGRHCRVEILSIRGSLPASMNGLSGILQYIHVFSLEWHLFKHRISSTSNIYHPLCLHGVKFPKVHVHISYFHAIGHFTCWRFWTWRPP